MRGVASFDSERQELVGFHYRLSNLDHCDPSVDLLCVAENDLFISPLANVCIPK